MLRKKIAFIVTKGDNIGGAQIYVLELAKKFNKKSYDVTVISGTTGFLTESLENEGIKTIHLNCLKASISPFHDFMTLIKLRQLLIKNKYSIVSLNSSKVGIIGRLVCYFSSTPCVFTVHGWSFTDGIPRINRILFRNIERALKKFCDGWINVSNYDYKLGITSKVLIKENSFVIHNGVRIKDVQKISKSKYFEYSNKLKIVCTARHDYQKDHITLFKALTKIENVEVYLLGDGPLVEFNKNQASLYGILDKVVFVGFTSEVDKYLAQADIFIMLSNWEGFPISILEAMNNKLPTIVSDVCGNNEAVIDNLTGFLIPSKNENILIQKISLLQANPNRIKEMGENAYNHLINNYNFEDVFNKTEKVFSKFMI